MTRTLIQGQFGDQVELEADQHLKLLAARIEDVLPYQFPEYQAFRQRPFTFLARLAELKVHGLVKFQAARS